MMDVHENTSDGTEHVSRSKDAAITRRSQKPIGCVVGGIRAIGALILIALLVSWIKSCGGDDDTSESDKTANAPGVQTFPPTSTVETETLVLRHQCFTPCDSVMINYAARIRRFGVPIRIYFLNTGDSVSYGASGGGSTPPDVNQVGYRRIVSLDSDKPNTLVKIFEVR